MKTTSPALRLEQMLAAVEHELLSASDTELLDAADELGLRPGMQGSVALLGVTIRHPRWLKRTPDAVEEPGERTAPAPPSRRKRPPPA
jgi:hypothetical protein